MRTVKAFLSLAIIFLFVLTPLARGQAGLAQSVDIPYKKFVLDNGLTVIIHEDHKAPIVAFNIWYHVGSKNEKPGKTGFAHLFEHLMFNGSENFKGDYFLPLEKVGATDLNGTTSEDRTNYFENVPVSAFDVALWMESDRMGHLLGAVTQAVLDEQRGVVQNEKRQYENEPYALSYDLITSNCFPKGHPYSWTVIGSMEDLSAASLQDAQEWFKTYYGAANAVIAVAGDITVEQALAKVKQYFGDIPSGPPITKYNAYTAKRTGVQRQVAQDRVPQARLYKAWNVPAWGTDCANRLELAAAVLSAGKNSRLYKRLVYDEQIATNVSAYVDAREIAGLFNIEATAKPGVDLAKVEKAVDEELDRFLREGPTAAELERVRAQHIAGIIRGLERIGGFGGKSDILATSQVFGGSPDAYKKNLAAIEKASVKDVQEAAQHWLSDGVYILEIHPFPAYKTVASNVDRTKLPEAGTPPDAKFSKLERTTLSNGLKVILARREAVPVVNFNLLLDAGYAADQSGLPGTASLAMNMLDEGTKTRSALQISEELQKLGASLNSGSSLDTSSVSLSALKANLDASLALYADVILNPSFPENEFKRLKAQTLAAIQQEKAEPFSIALRVFPKLLYGPGHAYGNPFTGSGTEAAVQSMTLAELQKFHQTWFKPNHATLVIVGAAGLDELKPKLEKLFSGWKQGEVPKKNISQVAGKNAPEVYLIDKPGSPSSIILGGFVTLPKANPEEIAVEIMNMILGGQFTSRINMNLREDKHWSYGAGSAVISARGQRPYVVYGIVQTDKTKESVFEAGKEIKEIVGTRPPTSDELNRNKSSQVLGLPGQWETNAAVGASIAEMVIYGYPENYFDTYAGKVKGLTLAQVSQAAKDALRPDGVVWVVVGDGAKVGPKLKELGFGEVHLIDADGNPVK
jgi:zinc protease